jgi:hypothetical protein
MGSEEGEVRGKELGVGSWELFARSIRRWYSRRVEGGGLVIVGCWLLEQNPKSRI